MVWKNKNAASSTKSNFETFHERFIIFTNQYTFPPVNAAKSFSDRCNCLITEQTKMSQLSKTKSSFWLTATCIVSQTSFAILTNCCILLVPGFSSCSANQRAKKRTCKFIGMCYFDILGWQTKICFLNGPSISEHLDITLDSTLSIKLKRWHRSDLLSS